MPKFPEPPSIAELAAIRPEVSELPAGTLLVRLYRRGGPHPTSWGSFRAVGPPSSRFDHHLPDPAGRPRTQERAICYAASDGITCLAEAFQTTRVVDRRAHHPWLVAFELVRSVPLLDLTSIWPTRAGASMTMTSGPRPRARRWARRIYEAYPQVEGLVYPSSMHANRLAFALWERAEDALPALPSFHRALADPDLLTVLRNAAAHLGYELT